MGSRRHAHAPLDGEGAAVASEAPDPEAQAAGKAEAARFDSVIATLPEEFREVLILREMEDMSYREIASATEAPIGTVMSRLARARALLRERWLAQGGGNELR